MATPSDLRARYPAFADVPDATLTYWLADAARFVDESWPIVSDRDPAAIAVAAHNAIRAGVAVAGSDVAAFAVAGVTDFKSGTFSARFSDDAVKAQVAGGFESTPYGQDYLALLRRNKGGGTVTLSGAPPCTSGFNGFAGPLGYPAVLFPC